MSPHILLEALLFYRASPMRKTDAAAALGCTPEELLSHVESLRTALTGRGIALVETSSELQLTTAPDAAAFIDAVRKDELRTEIGKAGAETLAIVLYKEPVTRAEIDQIRGVNSSVTIRNLLTRGLIARSNRSGQSGSLFTITPQLLSYLGIERKHDLPEYGAILDRIETFTATQSEATT